MTMPNPRTTPLPHPPARYPQMQGKSAEGSQGSQPGRKFYLAEMNALKCQQPSKTRLETAIFQLTRVPRNRLQPRSNTVPATDLGGAPNLSTHCATISTL